MHQLKTLEELTHTSEPGWDLVQQWLKDAQNKYEILPKDPFRAGQELVNAQITIRSCMGAVIYETGGILIDNGWLRILGSGSERLDRGLMQWNQGKTFEKYGDKPTHLLIADDIIGGYFAINAGGIGSDIGKIHYLAPDTLEWENMDCGYSDFLNWAFNGDIHLFYKLFRWADWQTDTPNVGGNQVFSFFPFLWTKEGKNIEQVDRCIVPIDENYRLTIEFQKQMAGQ